MADPRTDSAATPDGASAPDVILELDGVVAGYGSTTVLHGTSFEVRRHAITTVIGPNGAGKSTALKAVFGMIGVRSGDIRYDGEDLAGLSQVELLRRGISYVPQGRNIFPRMTVRANLELGGVSLGDRALVRRRIDEIAFDLFPVLRTKAASQAGNLSGGEQKMLEVGRAMLLDPRLLLIDEPSIGLSPLLVQQVFALLRGLRDRGVTVLMVEQNAKAALETSDFGLVLQQGRLALAGTAAEVLDHPEIGHLFLGGTIDTATSPAGPDRSSSDGPAGSTGTPAGSPAGVGGPSGSAGSTGSSAGSASSAGSVGDAAGSGDAGGPGAGG